MTDTFWFHICWNVESVTWPLWYGMIYWALTPVANVSGEGMGRAALQVDSVHQIAFRATAKWIASPLAGFFFFFKPITSRWVIVVRCLTASSSGQKVGKAGWNHVPCFNTDKARWGYQDTSCFVLPVRRVFRQIQAGTQNKAQWNLPSVHRGPLPKCSAFPNEVGWGHCLARYNYTVKLSLSARDNGR